MKSKSPARRVHLIRNGRNQAVRIPREFELPGEEATLRCDGTTGRLILEPVRQENLLALLASWASLREEETMPEVEDRPPEPIDL
jgi:antitoxin VapB